MTRAHIWQVSWVDEFSVGAGGAPEQFTINYGNSSDKMVIGWLTADASAATAVRYGTSSGNYPNTASGSGIQYVYSKKYTSGLIHHVTLTGLAPATTYYYQAGSTAAWSQEFSFTSSPGVGANIPFTFAVIADIGENSDANNTITHVLEGDAIDAVLHAGDISYASGCESSGCATWDAYQRMIRLVLSGGVNAARVGDDALAYASRRAGGRRVRSTILQLALTPSSPSSPLFSAR